VFDAVKHHKTNWRLFGAIALLGSIFLLTQYRLVYTMFIDSGFISHRIEFDIFFKENLWEFYRLSLVKFLQGHAPHSQALQLSYLIPISLFALLLSFSSHRFTKKESILVWFLFIVSVYFDLWSILLIHRFTLPVIFIISLIHIYKKPKYNTLSKMLIGIIILSIFASIFEYHGFHFLADTFHFFKSFNMTRMYFIAPLIWLIIFAYSLYLLYRKLSYTQYALITLVILQFNLSYNYSFYQLKPREGYVTFESYYVPDLYKKIKQTIHQYDNNQTVHIVHYGIEPAVSLFNGLYTVDGYSTNYPLDYKHQFRNIFSKYKQLDIYDNWGSKVYIGSITSKYKDFQMIKGLHIQKLQFDSDILCDLRTDYIITPYYLEHPETKNLKMVGHYKNTNPQDWEIYLYKLICDKTVDQ
jgi:hypothetical protein